MMPFPVGRAEEDRLDRLENLGVGSGALALRDFQALFPCLVLSGLLVAGIWLLRR